MARYRRRRYYRKKSGRWAANIQEIANTISPQGNTWSAAETILSNPTQQPSYVSQTFTVKNMELNFNLDYEGYDTQTDVNLYEGITVYIMFVPQGMNITNDYNIEHPEYIMAYKYIGSPTTESIYYPNNSSNAPGQQYQPTRIKSRLARKLQSGDSIVLFVKGNLTGTPSTSSTNRLRLSGVVRWWTKAN